MTLKQSALKELKQALKDLLDNKEIDPKYENALYILQYVKKENSHLISLTRKGADFLAENFN